MSTEGRPVAGTLFGAVHLLPARSLRRGTVRRERERQDVEGSTGHPRTFAVLSGVITTLVLIAASPTVATAAGPPHGGSGWFYGSTKENDWTAVSYFIRHGTRIREVYVTRGSVGMSGCNTGTIYGDRARWRDEERFVTQFDRRGRVMFSRVRVGKVWTEWVRGTRVSPARALRKAGYESDSWKKLERRLCA